MTDSTGHVDEAELHAARLVDAFVAYNNEFRDITRRARPTFEQRDWAAARLDAVQRIELYDRHVSNVIEDLRSALGDQAEDKQLWAGIKRNYAKAISEYTDEAFFKTFFSSITRQLFRTIGVDPSVEFTAFDIAPPDEVPVDAQVQTYQNRGNLELLIDQLLADFPISVPCRDRDRTVEFIAAEVDAYCASLGGDSKVEAISMLTMVFYRSTRAMLVGRIDGSDFSSPFIVALRNTDDGIVADAVILRTNDASMLFGFTRSYFLVDAPRPHDVARSHQELALGVFSVPCR